MRIGTYAALAFLAVVLDATVAPQMEILGARPDLLVLVVVYGSLVLGPRPATIAGFVMGLVADSEMSEYLGLHALALAVVGYLSGGLWDHLVRGNVFVQCGVLLAATLAHDAIPQPPRHVLPFRRPLRPHGRTLHGRAGRAGVRYSPRARMEGDRRWPQHVATASPSTLRARGPA